MSIFLTMLAACGVPNPVDTNREEETGNDDTDSVGGDTDTGPVETGDSDTDTDTAPVGETWDDVAALYDKDGDLFLSDQTPREKIEAILNGDVQNVPGDVITNLNENYNADTDEYLLDCDDDAIDGAISHPGAVEAADGYDNDCDGLPEFHREIDATTTYTSVYPSPHKVAAGDVNGDGQKDKIISSEYDGTNESGGINGEGQIKIYSGSSTSTTPDITIRGGAYDAMIGARLAVGDLDGDGFEDIVTPLPDYISPEGSWVGGVIIYYGRTDMEWQYAPSAAEAYEMGQDEASLEWSRDNGIAVIYGDTVDYLAWDVQLTGDLDGDTRSEIAMSSSVSPVIYRVPQAPSTISPRHEGGQYVQDVEGAGVVLNTRSGIGLFNFTSGDYNGDGVADLVTAVPDEDRITQDSAENRGIVTLAYGPLTPGIDTNDIDPYPEWSLADQGIPSRLFRGEYDGDQAGITMGTGNFDGGGDDLIIGSPTRDFGVTYVASGDTLDSLPDSSEGVTILGDSAIDAGVVALVAADGTESFPAAVGIGDMDGDNVDDLILASNRYGGDVVGATFVLSGAYVGSLYRERVSIAQEDQQASKESGFELGILDSPALYFATADFDGDGADDLLAGVYAGSTYLFGGGNHGN